MDRLTSHDFLALNVLGQSNGRLTLEQLWETEYVFESENRFTRATLSSSLDDLVRLGLLRSDNESISFAGDDFDRVYLKYYAREHGQRLQLLAMPPDQLWCDTLRQYLDKLKGVEVLGIHAVDAIGHACSIQEASKLLTGESDNAPEAIALSPFSLDLYRCMMSTARGHTAVATRQVDLCLPWIRVTFCLAVPCDLTLDSPPLADEELTLLRSRLEQCGGRLDVCDSMIPVIPADSLVGKMASSSVPWVLEELAWEHYHAARSAYGECFEHPTKRSEAIFNAQIAAKYKKDWPSECVSDFAYMLLASGEGGDTVPLFRSALSMNCKPEIRSLTEYDLAVALAKDGQLAESAELLRRVAASNSTAELLSANLDDCFLMKVSASTQGELVFEEVTHANLFGTAAASLQSVSQVLEAQALRLPADDVSGRCVDSLQTNPQESGATNTND